MKLGYLACCFLCIVFPYTNVFADTPTGATYRVGGIFPLTGDSSFWGVNPKNGIELALQDSVKHPGISLKVIYEDDHCDAKQAVSAFHKLVEVDKVKVILGPSCSSATLAVAPLAEKEGILLLAFSEADSISNAGDNVFRLWIPSGHQGRKLAHHVFEQAKLSRVAVMSAENAFGVEIGKAFSAEFEKLGGTIAIHEEYDTNARDFRTALLRVKSSKPQALFFASYIADGVSILKQAKELNVAERYFSASTINSPDFFKPLGPLSGGLEFFDIKDTTSEDFRKRYSAAYGTAWPGMQSGAAIFYDIVRVLAQLLSEGSHDVPQLRDALYSLKEYQGVSGMVQFDQNGDLLRTHTLFRVKDGQPSVAE